MKKVFALLAALILASCHMPINLASFMPKTTPLIQKTGEGIPSGESTPIVWGNRILVVSPGITIWDYSSKAVVTYDALSSLGNSGFGFTCAIVNQGILYIFGTSERTPVNDVSAGNFISMVSTTDLVNWTAPVIIYQAPTNKKFYNTSVCSSPYGFVMAIETRPVPSDIGFEETFAVSPDLLNWKPFGGVFLTADGYSSCPTLRYSTDGYFYMLHDSQNYPNSLGWFVDITRSKDLKIFKSNKSPYVVLSPFEPLIAYETAYENGGTGDVQAISNSDIDLCELNGVTYFIYDFGDQSTWGGVGEAIYAGPATKLFESFFTTP